MKKNGLSVEHSVWPEDWGGRGREKKGMRMQKEGEGVLLSFQRHCENLTACNEKSD